MCSSGGGGQQQQAAPAPTPPPNRLQSAKPAVAPANPIAKRSSRNPLRIDLSDSFASSVGSTSSGTANGLSIS